MWFSRKVVGALCSKELYTIKLSAIEPHAQKPHVIRVRWKTKHDPWPRISDTKEDSRLAVRL